MKTRFISSANKKKKERVVWTQHLRKTPHVKFIKSPLIQSCNSKTVKILRNRSKNIIRVKKGFTMNASRHSYHATKNERLLVIKREFIN